MPGSEMKAAVCAGISQELPRRGAIGVSDV
jgi:hypothetical protein